MEKKYDFHQSEQQMQKLWEHEKTYATPRDSKPVFSIDTPPPTVSGSLHIGHIFSYTQTDIIARYKRMSGFSVFYPFGFDDNGLPTERFVEKKRGIRAQNLSRSEFIKVCLEETVAVEKQFESLWQRMGLSVDWEKCYSTIDESSRRISQASFIELYKKGYVYRKDEPALYCTVCQTSVAQAELDDAQEPSIFYDLKFSDEAGNPLVIATTRPELLPSCVAVLYNPNDSRYQHLKGKQARVALFDLTVPLLADEQVMMDKGTGLVMCCTFGDKTDVAWFKKFNLPYRPSLGRDGRWLPTTGILAGLNAKQARKAVVAALQEAGLVLQERPIQHAVSIHERCKNPIEFLALKQWFLKLLPYKQDLIACADKINWYPAFMKARYKDWVENLSWDWGLSRQRFYGIPFPAWHCIDCGQTLLPSEEMLPVDPQEMAYPGPCSACNSKNIEPDTDVMDTWNTSSLTPYICKALYDGDDKSMFSKPYAPMSMRPQAHDIIRTWAFYTITKTWMHHGMIPWQDIVISGHVLSSEKEKISKSRGNSAMEPENLLQQHAADAVRYWTASGTLGHDVAFSEDQLKMGNRLLTKLWNAFLFIAEHTKDSELNPRMQPKYVANEWILHQASVCFDEYKKYFEQHEFGLALTRVEKFFWNDVCDNYLECVKDQLFNPANYEASEVAETKQTLFAVGLRLLQMYGPFMPHMTEMIYQSLYKAACKTASLHTTQYAESQVAYTAAQERLDLMRHMLHIIVNVRKLKTDQKLSLKTDLAQLTIGGFEEILKQLPAQQALLRGVTRAQEFVFVASSAKTGIEQQGEQWHAWLVLEQ